MNASMGGATGQYFFLFLQKSIIKFKKCRLHQVKLYSFAIGYYDFPFSFLTEGHAIFRHEVMKNFISEVNFSILRSQLAYSLLAFIEL